MPTAVAAVADDFGFGVQTSRGIIQAHLDGPVLSTSMMVVTGAHVRDSIELLAQAPRLEVGLHLVLTQCGHAPLAARAGSGLTDRRGNLLSNARLWISASLGRIHRDAVAEEIARQAELFQVLLGRPPAYVDGHHHAHQLPTIREALCDVIRSGLLPPITRCTLEPPSAAGAVVRRCMARRLGRAAGPLFDRNGVGHNDFFFGMLTPGDLRADFPWDRSLQRLPDSGTVEWVVHPGMADETLVGRDDYHAHRPRELAALTDPALRPHWQSVAPLLCRKSALLNAANRAL